MLLIFIIIKMLIGWTISSNNGISYINRDNNS